MTLDVIIKEYNIFIDIIHFIRIHKYVSDKVKWNTHSDDLITLIFFENKSFIKTNMGKITILLFALLLRILISFGSYSGLIVY